LQEFHLLVNVFVVHANSTHANIRMSIHKLSQRVCDHVSTQLQRSLEVRGQKSVVDDQNNLEKLKSEMILCQYDPSKTYIIARVSNHKRESFQINHI
jgi:hypothetical protein